MHVFTCRVENSVDPYQLASGSTQFYKQDVSWLRHGEG